MIVRAETITIVAGRHWLDRIEIFGPTERVLEEGARDHHWIAEHSEGGVLSVTLSWFRGDGWHVHATNHGHDGRLLLSVSWRPVGAVSVQLTSGGEGPVGIVELRKVER